MISVFAERTDDARAVVHVNPNGASRMKREIGWATALGHVLLDECPVAMDCSSPLATTLRLKNLGLISRDQQLELAQLVS